MLEISNKIIRVLMIEPGQHPKSAYLETNMSAFNAAVSIGSNELGKVDSKKLEKSIYAIYNKDHFFIGLEENRKIGTTIISGVFYIVKVNEKYMPISLSNKDVEKYTVRFWCPEQFTDIEIIESNIDNLYKTLQSNNQKQ